MFENDLVRITELRMNPGDHEAEHQHARGVTVSLSVYDNEVVALPEGTVGKRHTDFGEVRWADASHHETRNTGKTLQRVIRVELKREPGPSSAAAAADPLDSLIACKDTQRLVLENAYVRVIEERVPAGVAQPKHRHRHGVLIPLADSDLEVVEFADGRSSSPVRRQLRFADAGWRDPAEHTVKNAGTTELRNIRIEVK